MKLAFRRGRRRASHHDGMHASARCRRVIFLASRASSVGSTSPPARRGARVAACAHEERQHRPERRGERYSVGDAHLLKPCPKMAKEGTCSPRPRARAADDVAPESHHGRE
eukprot:scaffold100234_cov21-Tisochrysis_lutea.AAC.1